MTFICNSCDTSRSFEQDFSILVIEKWGSGVKRYCRFCRKPKGGVADVYWDGKPEINLADGPDGKPRTFSSKGEKAAYLKEKGLLEAGDKYHGAPMQASVHKPRVDSRHEVQMALKKVKEMGADRRRFEYQRLLREGQRHA